jgi:hypothetical protein
MQEHVRTCVRPVDLQRRVGVGAAVEQELGDLEVAAMRRQVEPRHPALQGRATRKGTGGSSAHGEKPFPFPFE